MDAYLQKNTEFSKYVYALTSVYIYIHSMYHTIGTSILKPGMHHKDISAGTHIQRAGIRGHIIITIHHLFNTHGPESRRYTFGISHCVWGWARSSLNIRRKSIDLGSDMFISPCTEYEILHRSG